MVNVSDGPAHDAGDVGVTIIESMMSDVVLLTAVKDAISPLPEEARPIELLVMALQSAEASVARDRRRKES